MTPGGAPEHVVQVVARNTRQGRAHPRARVVRLNLDDPEALVDPADLHPNVRELLEQLRMPGRRSIQSSAYKVQDLHGAFTQAIELFLSRLAGRSNRFYPFLLRAVDDTHHANLETHPRRLVHGLWLIATSRPDPQAPCRMDSAPATRPDVPGGCRCPPGVGLRIRRPRIADEAAHQILEFCNVKRLPQGRDLRIPTRHRRRTGSGPRVFSHWIVTDDYVRTDPIEKRKVPKVPNAIVETFTTDR